MRDAGLNAAGVWTEGEVVDQVAEALRDTTTGTLADGAAAEAAREIVRRLSHSRALRDFSPPVEGEAKPGSA